MTIELTVQGDLTRITRSLTRLQRQTLPKASVTAINNTAKKARTQAAKDAAKRMRVNQNLMNFRTDADGRVKKGEKNRRTTIRNATRQRPTAVLSVYHRGIPVNALLSKAQRTPTAQRKRKGRGVKAAGGRLYVGAFVARSKTSSAFVYKREGKRRRPVFAVKKSVRAGLEDAHRDWLRQKGGRVFRRELVRQIRRYTR